MSTPSERPARPATGAAEQAQEPAMSIQPEPESAPAPRSPAIASSTSDAPRPSRRTLAMRSFLPVQAWRFLVINLRMARIIFKPHD